MHKPKDKAFKLLPTHAGAPFARLAIAVALVGALGSSPVRALDATPAAAAAGGATAPAPKAVTTTPAGASEVKQAAEAPTAALPAPPAKPHDPAEGALVPAPKTVTTAPAGASELKQPTEPLTAALPTPPAKPHGPAEGAPVPAPKAVTTAPAGASEVKQAVEAPTAALPAPSAKPRHDLTPIGMFISADPVVQGVMIILIAASVVTWTILLMKVLELFFAKRRMRRTLDDLRAADTLDDASGRIRKGLGSRLLLETEEELDASRGLPSDGIKERALIALQRIETAAAKRMAIGTGILATIGSIGPFVGLFGTVWGIMRSFIGIANSNTTNLAVVAPGIAEALLATGIGLVAAIPAVVIYNVLTRSIGWYRTMIGDAVALIMRHLSRDLDRREVGVGSKSAPRPRIAAE